MKPVEVENVGVMTISVKSLPGQQKSGKSPLSAKNAIFTYFGTSFFFLSLPLKKKTLI